MASGKPSNGIVTIGRNREEIVTEELPLVSIVTPSYNQAHFLEETILSVLNQDYPNVEYIVIDGGSTDGSVDIIRKYEDRLAHWVSEPDEGQSDAINKGWRCARGDILAYLNSDDTYLPGALRTVVQYLQNYPRVDMVYGYLNWIDEGGRVTWTTEPSTDFDLDSLIYYAFFIPQPTVFFRKHVLDKVGMLDTSLYYCMDTDLWHRIGMNFTVRGIPTAIANFRTHLASKTHNVSPDFMMERHRIAQRYGGADNTAPVAGLVVSRWARLLTHDLGKDHRAGLERDWASLPSELSCAIQPSKRRITSRAYLKAALVHVVSGRLSRAGTYFWSAVREDPSVLVRDGGIFLTIARVCRRLVRASSRYPLGYTKGHGTPSD
jgi:glycosyltransferase involved in cell wall biosynthesis